jgi:hypothetical protein
VNTLWEAVYPNLIASALWATPAFIAQHLLLRRHITRTHNGARDRFDHDG